MTKTSFVGSDLSPIHKTLTSEFNQLNDSVGDFRLTVEQIQFFHREGYLSGIRLLNEPQLDLLRNELTELMQANHAGNQYWYEYNSNESTNPDKILFHALGAWRIRPGFHDALRNQKFLIAASQLLDGSVRFWHDQLFCKPAHSGGVVAWHQDYSYWTRTKPMAHLTCWIGLDDSTTANGCLHYIPGSHEWDLLPITGLAENMDAIKEVLTDEQLESFSKPVAIELDAGECAFHHPLMVHGSYENSSDHARRAMVINVFRDGVCSQSDDELLAGVPPIPAGEKMQGQFFPLLFEN